MMRKFALPFDAAGIEVSYSPGSRVSLTPEHSVAMTELMIKLTRDVVFPDSRLHMWKVMAMDDYLGSIDVVSSSVSFRAARSRGLPADGSR